MKTKPALFILLSVVSFVFVFLFSGCKSLSSGLGGDFTSSTAPLYAENFDIPEEYYAYVFYRTYTYTASGGNVILTSADFPAIVLENDSYSILISKSKSIHLTVSSVMGSYMQHLDLEDLHRIVTEQDGAFETPGRTVHEPTSNRADTAEVNGEAAKGPTGYPTASLHHIDDVMISGTPSAVSYFKCDLSRMLNPIMNKGTFTPSDMASCRLSKYATPVEDQLAALDLPATENDTTAESTVEPQVTPASSAGREVDRSTLPILTVFDFAIQGMSEQESMFIVDILSSALFDTRQYRILDRNQRNKILEEVEFSLSGCTDEECQLEVGQMLAADKIVTGSLGTIGNRYAINIKLIDVASGETISTAYSIYEDLDALVDDCTTLAFQLADNEG